MKMKQEGIVKGSNAGTMYDYEQSIPQKCSQ